MKFYVNLISLLLMVITILIPAQELENTSKKIIAVRSNEKIIIDGVLSESIWKRQGFSELLQFDPNQGKLPSLKTEIWIAYDDEAIYYAAKHYDPNPDSILARLVRRDYIWSDPSDGSLLYLDSYNDKRTGYYFYVNAAGSVADGLLGNDSKWPSDLSWDAVWEGASHINSDGWSVEMKIPFSQLRFNEGKNQVWGINIERYIARNYETDNIVYTPRNQSRFVSRFPELIGIEGITPKTRLELLPYSTGRAEYVGGEPNNPFNPGNKYLYGLGLDIRVGLGNSLTMNGTINPDFGQVEVDPAVVNLTDVETSYEEKRPFFTEGVNIYRFGMGGIENNLFGFNNNNSNNWPGVNIFYSRRIGRAPQASLPAYDYADIPKGIHILGAVKVSGKIFDDWKFGTIQSLTKREFADIDLNGQQTSIEVEPSTYYGVFRMQKDFNGGLQGLGLLSTFTNRFFNDSNLKNNINKNALVSGVDGWIFLDNEKTYVFSGWIALSSVSGDKNRMTSLQKNAGHYFQRPDITYISVDSSATSMTGYAGRLTLNKNRGDFRISAALGWLSPKFEVNDLGYGSYSDVINLHVSSIYSFSKPTDFYQYAGINAAAFANFDFGGNKTSQGYVLGGYFFLTNLSNGNFSFTYNPETYNSRRTRGGPLTLNPLNRSLSLMLFGNSSAMLVPSLRLFTNSGDNANTQNITLNIELKVTPTLTIQVGPNIAKENYYAQWINSFTDKSATETFYKRYVFAHLEQKTFAADIRADWIISPTLSFQVYLQPLIVSGKYSDFKALQKPKTFDFLKYGENGSTITKTLSFTGDVSSYTVDADGTGPAEAFQISNPNFNYFSLRGSAVFRWEYLPGSTLFFVWTQTRQDNETTSEFSFQRSMDSLFDVKPDNIFIVKLTYYINL